MAQVDVAMYILADKYDISSLKSKTMQNLRSDTAEWNLELVGQKAITLAMLLETAYGTPVPAVCEVLVPRLVDLGLFSGPKKVEALLDLVDRCPGYGRDVIRYLGERDHMAAEARLSAARSRFRCSNCFNTHDKADAPKAFDLILDSWTYYCPSCDHPTDEEAWEPAN